MKWRTVTRKKAKKQSKRARERESEGGREIGRREGGWSRLETHKLNVIIISDVVWPNIP